MWVSAAGNSCAPGNCSTVWIFLYEIQEFFEINSILMDEKKRLTKKHLYIFTFHMLWLLFIDLHACKTGTDSDFIW